MGDESSPRSDQTGEERGVVQYDTPRGQITLTIQIVRRFFCPKATELEALAFAGYCKHTGLNPFLREVYLVKYDESEPASIITAYQSFMKRAERAEGYGGFRAGVVLLPDPEGPPGEIIKGEDLPGVPPPFVALEGTLIPPGYTLAGGWCQVTRAGRPSIVSTVRLEEYLQRRRDGKPTRAWERMPATMIRKVPVGQAHRDAWPDELAGLVLEEEGGARIGAGEPATPPDLMPRRVGESAPGPEIANPLDGPLTEAETAIEIGAELPPDPMVEVHVPNPSPPTPPAEPVAAAPEPPPPLAPGMVSFTLNNREMVTAGVTKEQFLKIVKLSAQVDQLCGKGAAKDLLGRECGVEHRTELTEAGAATYLAILAKRANQAIAERGRA